MQVVYERCAGVDVHQRTVVVTVLLSDAPGRTHNETRTFGTMTADLLALSQWLEGLGVTHGARESTGVYWWPVYNLLEEGRSILLVNPRHIKAVPGRKTDVKACSVARRPLATRAAARQLRPAPADSRVARADALPQEPRAGAGAAGQPRARGVLEGANIKLAAVATDVLGKSAREMLELLLVGEQDVAALAEHARTRMRPKMAELKRALQGHLQPQHRFLLRSLLAHIDFLDAAIEETQAEIERQLAPYQDAVRLLQTIPGIQEVAAATIVAEIGVDMARFPSAQHLASWAGLCPGNKQSGGKRMSEAITKGSPWLRGVLGEVVWSIAHTRDNYLVAQYRRLSKRRGVHKAVVAVAHSVLVIIYHMLRDQRAYTDLGADYFDQLGAARLERHHVRRLEQLGYTVTLTPANVA